MTWPTPWTPPGSAMGMAPRWLEALIDYARARRAGAVTVKIAQENEASNALARKVGAQIIATGSFTKEGTGEVIPNFLYELKL